METAELRTLARSLSKEHFVERLPGLFFITHVERDEVIEYQTMVIAPGTLPPPPQAVSPIESASRGQTTVVIRLSKAPGNPYPDRISIGRARNCDVVLRDASVSKLHAHLRPEDRGAQLSDVGTRNGTRVNGARLRANEPLRVEPGDQMAFGRVAGRLADAAMVWELLSR